MESNKTKNWAKGAAICAGCALIASIAIPIALTEPTTNSALQDQITALQEGVNAIGPLDVVYTEGEKTTAIYDKIFEEDAWDSEAEIIAKDELEKKDYRDLGDYLVDEYDNLEDEDDIEKVLIKDVTVKNADVDDKDAIVELELKVYYENDNGKTIKKYITATAIIEDGEVEDLDFDETA